MLDTIKSLCIKRGISVAKLERELGLGNGSVARWSTNRPSVDKVKKVADYFGVTVDELLKEE